MEKLNQIRGRAVYVDLIRMTAIICVILLHASGQWVITSEELSQLNIPEAISWFIVDVYQTVSVMGVPLFLMVTGALLLQPGKENESLSVFFKKRWTRIGLPFIFWCVVYFLWVFLVQNMPFRLEVIAQGLLVGPYTQFWYIYVLMGLYLLTPILRIFIAHANQTTIKYFVLLWVIGTAILPVFGLLPVYHLHTSVFVITGYVGYFVLGTYLPTVETRRSNTVVLMLLGIALTVVGTYVLAATGAGTEMYFFQEYLSPTVMLASVMVFLLLLRLQPPSTQKEAHYSKLSKLVKLISQNTLAIYFVHVIVLESFQKGYFGFAINRSTLNPAVEIQVITVLVLFVSLAVVVLLKKIPYMNKLVG